MDSPEELRGLLVINCPKRHVLLHRRTHATGRRIRHSEAEARLRQVRSQRDRSLQDFDLYSSIASGNQEIWIMAADGSGLRQLTAEGAELRWTPDGRGITYIDNRSDVGNVWLQPLGGGPPQQVTDFKSDFMYRFDWSRDGNELVCSRGMQTNDAVLIGDIRPKSEGMRSEHSLP